MSLVRHNPGAVAGATAAGGYALSQAVNQFQSAITDYMKDTKKRKGKATKRTAKKARSSGSEYPEGPKNSSNLVTGQRDYYVKKKKGVCLLRREKRRTSLCVSRER